MSSVKMNSNMVVEKYEKNKPIRIVTLAGILPQGVINNKTQLKKFNQDFTKTGKKGTSFKSIKLINDKGEYYYYMLLKEGDNASLQKSLAAIYDFPKQYCEKNEMYGEFAKDLLKGPLFRCGVSVGSVGSIGNRCVGGYVNDACINALKVFDDITKIYKNIKVAFKSPYYEMESIDFVMNWAETTIGCMKDKPELENARNNLIETWDLVARQLRDELRKSNFWSKEDGFNVFCQITSTIHDRIEDMVRLCEDYWDSVDEVVDPVGKKMMRKMVRCSNRFKNSSFRAPLNKRMYLFLSAKSRVKTLIRDKKRQREAK